LEFFHKFGSAVQSVEFSPNAGNHLLVLLADATVQIVTAEAALISCPGSFARVQWSHTAPTFFGAENRSLCQIAYPSLEIVNRWAFNEPKTKPITFLAVSPNDRFVVLLDGGGSGRCFSVVAHATVARYTDAVERLRFAHAIFDRSSEYVIIASKTMAREALRVYTVQPRNLVKMFHGPSDPILQLFGHPLDSVIYARLKSGLVAWKVSKRFKYRNSVPHTGLKRANWVFEEPEDFFDRRPEDEQRAAADRPRAKAALSADYFVPADPSLLPDDKNYPAQLLALPWRPEVEQ
jgi:hypothetical protein